MRQRRSTPPTRRGPRSPAAAAGRPASRQQARTAAGTAAGDRGLAGPWPHLRQAAHVASGVAADWMPTVARIILGLVLAWFGYHELVRPGEWTGYVPVVQPGSSPAIVLVLAHGWVLLVVAAALVGGVAPRAAAAIAAVLLVEIVVSLTVTGGLSDLTLRDTGVLGLAACLTGDVRHRLVLRG